MSSHTKIPVLAALVLSCLVVYRYIIYPAFLSPLSKVANAHPTSSISPLWIWWVRYSFRENRTIYAAHKKHGPVVRLSPSELSVNCVDQGLRTIYAGGFEKHAWYRFFANFDGVANMASIVKFVFDSMPNGNKESSPLFQASLTRCVSACLPTSIPSPTCKTQHHYPQSLAS